MKLNTDPHAKPVIQRETLDYEARSVVYCGDLRMVYHPWPPATEGQLIASIRQQAELMYRHNEHRLTTMFNEGYRNDDIATVDIKNEEVTRTVVIELVEPATLWHRIKLTLKERWPRLFSRLSVRRSSRAVTREVKFTVPVARNVTVQFIDPFCIPPDGLRTWRRTLCGRNEDAEAIITVMRKKAAEHVRSER